VELPDLARGAAAAVSSGAAAALTLVLSLATLSCASGARPRAESAATPRSAAGDRGQWLFRAEVDGPDGGATLRLSLRDYGSGRFELGAADALGQSRWRLVVDGDDALLLDVERRRYCRLAADAPFALPRLRLALPVGALPRLLRRELPVAPAEEGEGDTLDFLDATGSRWTATRADGTWHTWTLWGDGGPRIWAKLQGAEATLSSRDPAFQMRWRERAHEPLPPDAQPPGSPEKGYAEGDCDAAAA
jgi:hypothetical protein